MRRGVRRWLPVVLLVGVAIAAVSTGVPVGTDGPAAVPDSRAAASDADSEATPIESCTTISEPGRYALTEDIENGGGTILSRACIRINASDVVLDGGGHAVDGRGTSNTTGVAVTHAAERNVTVSDLRVTGWHRGVDYGRASCGRVSDVVAANNSYGLYLGEATGVRVSDSELRDNLVGVETVWAVNRLSGVDARENAGADVHRRLPAPRQLAERMDCRPPNGD
ncbi:hypothetical protein [Haloprofundus halobius]|uniref:hypothetical protein n=1 Tax=Haloprofundus halobius TaxID=2876194 RepID=UPI001CC931D6|nr:hypothetical protein [Haloprofundus halobius]